MYLHKWDSFGAWKDVIIATFKTPTISEKSYKVESLEIKVFVHFNHKETYWSIIFKMVCNASGLELGIVLGQSKNKLFHPINFASKTLIFPKIMTPWRNKGWYPSCMILKVYNKFIGYETYRSYWHEAVQHLISKEETNPRLIQLVLPLKEFDNEVWDRKGSEE